MSTPIYTFDGNAIVPNGIPDQTLDTSSTAFQLPGRGYSTYGEQVLQDIIWTSQNFAGLEEPLPAFKGQLWYDTNSRQLKIYDPDIYGSNWEILSPLSSPTGNNPVNPPIPKNNIDAINVYDNNGNIHDVLRITVNSNVVGIFSGDQFTINNASSISSLGGLSNIVIGFNSIETGSFQEVETNFISFTGNVSTKPSPGIISFDGQKYIFGFEDDQGNLSWEEPVFGTNSVINQIYVSTTGNDVNLATNLMATGSVNSPFRTISAAIFYAETKLSYIDSIEIFVDQGTYVEFNPIFVPSGISIIASSPNNTFVQPLNPNLDVFHLTNANVIKGLTIIGNVNGSAFSFPTSAVSTGINQGTLSSISYAFSYPGYQPGLNQINFELNSTCTGNAIVYGNSVNGALTSIVVSNPGSGYVPNYSYNLNITSGLSQASAIAYTNNLGGISNVVITNPGFNFSSNITITPPTSPTGNNAVLVVPIAPVFSNGELVTGTTVNYINGSQSNTVLVPFTGIQNGILSNFSLAGMTIDYEFEPIVSIALPTKPNVNIKPEIISCTVNANPQFGGLVDGSLVTSNDPGMIFRDCNFNNSNFGIVSTRNGFGIISGSYMSANQVSIAARSGGKIISEGNYIKNSNCACQLTGYNNIPVAVSAISSIISTTQFNVGISQLNVDGMAVLIGNQTSQLVSIINNIMTVSTPMSPAIGQTVTIVSASSILGTIFSSNVENFFYQLNQNDPYYNALTIIDENGTTQFGNVWNWSNSSTTLNVSGQVTALPATTGNQLVTLNQLLNGANSTSSSTNAWVSNSFVSINGGNIYGSLDVFGTVSVSNAITPSQAPTLGQVETLISNSLTEFATESWTSNNFISVWGGNLLAGLNFCITNEGNVTIESTISAGENNNLVITTGGNVVTTIQSDGQLLLGNQAINGSAAPTFSQVQSWASQNFSLSSNSYRNIITINQGSGTWSVPNGVQYLRVTLYGAGGGGGGSGILNNIAVGGGGGGSGGYGQSIITTSPGTNYTYSVGTGGAGSQSSNANNEFYQGSSGVMTVFGPLSVNGGLGGNVGNTNAGGSGGVGSGFTASSITYQGNAGSPGNTSSGGNGGGFGGAGAGATFGQQGSDGSPPGGGGGGAGASAQISISGGSGGNGFIIIEY